MTSDESLAKQYQKKTDKQHILDNPDTYIGSVENVDADMWVYDDATQKIALKTIEYIPGLYKLFDEGIVNCRDHVIRMIQSTMLEKNLLRILILILPKMVQLPSPMMAMVLILLNIRSMTFGYPK